MMQKETLDLVFSFLGGRHAISKGWLNMQPVAERTFVLLYCPHMYGAVALKLPKEEDTLLPTIQPKQNFQHIDSFYRPMNWISRCRRCSGTNIVISDEAQDAVNVVLATLELRHDMQCVSSFQKSFAARLWETKRLVSSQLQCGRCRTSVAYVFDLLSHHEARELTFDKWIGIVRTRRRLSRTPLPDCPSRQSLY